MIDAFDVLSAA